METPRGGRGARRVHGRETVLLSIFKNSKVSVDAHEQSDKAYTQTNVAEGICISN